MAQVTQSIRIAAPAGEVWAMIGDFHGLAAWQPLVAKSEKLEEGGVVYRRLTLADGAVVVESMDDHDDERRSSSYTMTDVGPLPLASYRSTIAVEEAGPERSVVEWTGTFEPNGAPLEEVARAVSGIYAAGLGAIAERFGAAG